MTPTPAKHAFLNQLDGWVALVACHQCDAHWFGAGAVLPPERAQ